MARKTKKVPEFGDREALSKLRQLAAERDLDEERKLKGKVFTVCVQYSVTEEHERKLEVIALDESDAEELACQKILETEGSADEDSVETRIVDVREQGKGKDDERTLEMFPNQIAECGKS